MFMLCMFGTKLISKLHKNSFYKYHNFKFMKLYKIYLQYNYQLDLAVIVIYITY